MSERQEHYAATTHPTALTTAQQHWAMTMRRMVNALRASEDRTGLLLDAVIVHRGVDGELSGLDAHLRVEVGHGPATEPPNNNNNNTEGS